VNLINLSRFPAGLTLVTNKHGHEHVLAVAKATFEVRDDGSCALAGLQQPLVYADEYFGEPGLSSVRYESDFAFTKTKADVILIGTACAPGGVPTEVVEVSLEAGSLRKTVRVFGDRIWKPSLVGGYTASDPIPFVKMPLLYERAFGGADRSHEDEKKHRFEESNLVGVGYHSRVFGEIAGSRLPNLEDPHHAITSPLDRVRPMGFGFVSRNWLPRRRHAGTYDQKWLDERSPFLPLDFDDRYFQAAPEDQTCDFLNGGERVAVTGSTARGRWTFSLPALQVPVKLVYRSGPVDVRSVLDTLILEPDANRFSLTWRASARLQGKPCHLREVWVGTPSSARLRAQATGKKYQGWLKVRA
jgi:hypothetical protein